MSPKTVRHMDRIKSWLCQESGSQPTILRIQAMIAVLFAFVTSRRVICYASYLVNTVSISVVLTSGCAGTSAARSASAQLTMSPCKLESWSTSGG